MSVPAHPGPSSTHDDLAGGGEMGALMRSVQRKGRLWATANDGPGATFQFTMPIWPQSGTG